jgi:hypothetical protein
VGYEGAREVTHPTVSTRASIYMVHVAGLYGIGFCSSPLAVRSLRSNTVRSQIAIFGIYIGQEPDTSPDTFEIETGHSSDTLSDERFTIGQGVKCVAFTLSGHPSLKRAAGDLSCVKSGRWVYECSDRVTRGRS